MNSKSKYARRRISAQAEGGADYLAKRQELVDIASRLFKEKGYKATTLADIGKVAGLDRATVYYYVGSKEELFRAAVEGVLVENVAEAERIQARADLDARQKLELLILGLMRSYEVNYPQMYVYIQEQMHQVAKEPSQWAAEMRRKTRRFEEVFLQILSQGSEDGLFRKDVPVKLAANALFGMLNWAHRWHKPDIGPSADIIAGSFASLFLEGMLAGGTRTRARKSPSVRKGSVRSAPKKAKAID